MDEETVEDAVNDERALAGQAVLGGQPFVRSLQHVPDRTEEDPADGRAEDKTQSGLDHPAAQLTDVLDQRHAPVGTDGRLAARRKDTFIDDKSPRSYGSSGLLAVLRVVQRRAIGGRAVTGR